MQLSVVQVRPSTPDDLSGIEQLYADAFPDEDLIPVVRELLDLGEMSLVAEKNGAIVGHVLFTQCEVAGEKVSMLAPLCAAPALHRQGIGTALVQEGLARLKRDGMGWVYVLGDPNYYGRFGFQTENDVAPPYPLPNEWQDLGAWQSMAVGNTPALKGKLEVPAPWRHQKYWSEDQRA